MIISITMRLLRTLICAAVLAAGALSAPLSRADESMAVALAGIESRWAEIKYHLTDDDVRLDRARAMIRDSAEIAARYPDKPEPLVWQALALLLEAEVRSDLATLGIVKKARNLLEQVESTTPSLMDGSVTAMLGALYYEVPGWPLSFGDGKKAVFYLKKALAINPDGMDPNYFYGDYLTQRGKRREAVPYLEKALSVPTRPGHQAADEGRKRDIQETLVLARKVR